MLTTPREIPSHVLVGDPMKHTHTHCQYMQNHHNRTSMYHLLVPIAKRKNDIRILNVCE